MAIFDGVAIGDQLEVPVGRMMWRDPLETRDPNRPAQVWIVTHIWHDPVEDKEYVGLAQVRADGSHGAPVRKHTRRGLASQGYRRAKIDWIARQSAVASGEVVPLKRKR